MEINGENGNSPKDDSGDEIEFSEPNGRQLERIILAELAELSDGLADINSRLRRENNGGGGGNGNDGYNKIVWWIITVLLAATAFGAVQLYFLMRGTDDIQTARIQAVEKIADSTAARIDQMNILSNREISELRTRIVVLENEVREAREARIAEKAAKGGR